MREKRFIITLLFLIGLLFILPSAVSAYENEWVTEADGSTYYYNAAGSPYTGGPVQLARNGKKALFLFGADGKLLQNAVTQKDGKLYLSQKDGSLLTTWKKVNGKIYYGCSKGYLLTGKQTRKGYIYYFQKDGTALRSAFKKIGKYYYYFKSNGIAVRGKFFTVKGKRYYFDKNGRRLTGVRKIGKYYYGLHPKNGSLQYGWKKYKGKYYYFQKSKSGRACAGGFYKISGKTYYFNASGVRQTGWLTVDSKTYYMNPKKSGAMTTGSAKINGNSYTFGKDGSLMFSKDAVKTIRVNRSKCVVTVYQGDIPIKAMICSVGLNGATPTGSNFYIQDHLRWWDLNGPSVGQFCSHFLPNYLFHSVPMDGTSRDPYNVKAYKFNKLGQPASEGCIRLCVRDAKWIYDNCPIGSKVVISDHESTPLGKPTLPKMPEGTIGKDPTDIWN